ncbi:MAG: QacE family quaternary ammonium compound efflux SMR transporter [Burkholderiaceae bacterium]|nr:QacE family quaternary ammonium compound efflux SMR transporter [Burkholderiaceae bacterium]
MKWLLLFLAIIAEVIATTAMKSSIGFTRWVPSAITVVGYGIAFYLLSLTLKSIPVGMAYAIWSGVGIVLISLIAWLFYGQKLDTAALIGIGFIVLGVIVIQVFSKAVAT